jgi:antirestriction protein ArdC
MNPELKDLYQRVTDQIVKAIESGAADWKMPWHQTGSENFTPINASTKKPYRGVNILSLWAAADANGYATGLWATYKQWQELGAQVKKGEKATLVVFWKFSDRDAAEDAGDAEEREEHISRGVLARGYSVFNAAQVDGYQAPAVPLISEAERIESAERFFAGLGADIRHGGGRAYYSPSSDHIQMPNFEVFKDAVGYYAVLAHESTHNAEFRIMPRRMM